LDSRKKAQKAQKVLTTNGHETHELKAESENGKHPTTNIEHPTSNNLKLETGDLKART
jgi:hypothetical protein